MAASVRKSIPGTSSGNCAICASGSVNSPFPVGFKEGTPSGSYCINIYRNVHWKYMHTWMLYFRNYQPLHSSVPPRPQEKKISKKNPPDFLVAFVSDLLRSSRSQTAWLWRFSSTSSKAFLCGCGCKQALVHLAFHGNITHRIHGYPWDWYICRSI